MPALEVGPQLDLVDRNKSHIEVTRHGLDGRDPEARIRRLDLLFAGDQGNGVLAHPIGDLVVDLAGEQPQRQANNAGRMRQHALDREMGLAGIGRAEHGGHAGAARSRRPGSLLGKRDSHYASGLATEASWITPVANFCITMRRQPCVLLSLRTSLERIAPESLTRGLYSFVHGD